MPGAFAGEFRITGLKQLITAADLASKETSKIVRGALREAATPILEDAKRRFEPVSDVSAAGFGISVRRAGSIRIEQRLRKTTGTRPDYGALQMTRALLPALNENQGELERTLGHAVDKIVEAMNGGL